MELNHLSIDIATCVSNSSNEGLIRLYCLESDDANYCCKVNNASNLLLDSGERKCCSYDEYLDQQWVTAASIQGFSLLLVVLFFYFIIVVVWFYLTTFRIKQADVDATRRRVIRQLLKKQILHKSKLKPGPSLVSSIRQLSKTLSSSRSKSKSKRADKRTLKSSKNSLKSDENNVNKRRKQKSPTKSPHKSPSKPPHTSPSRSPIKPILKSPRKSPNEPDRRSPGKSPEGNIKSPLKARKSDSSNHPFSPVKSAKTNNRKQRHSSPGFGRKKSDSNFKSPKSPRKL